MGREGVFGILNKGKIVILKSRPGGGAISYMQKKMAEDWSSLNVKVLHSKPICNSYDIQTALADDPDVLLIDDIFYGNDVRNIYAFLESICDTTRIIIRLHHGMLDFMRNNDKYVEYAFHTEEDKDRAYNGEPMNYYIEYESGDSFECETLDELLENIKDAIATAQNSNKEKVTIKVTSDY